MKGFHRSFYERDAARVARDLLGKVLVHRSPEGVTSGMIVETEAYFGKRDPASRASRKRTKLNDLMWWQGGLAFVYMVHNHWMFNVTAEREGIPGAVLLRAVEPLEGMDLMKQRRGVNDERLLTSGPGRMTKAMGITYSHHKLDLTKSRTLTIVNATPKKFKISRSHRIGVSADLKRKLRFYMDGNRFVSR
ncbi:MAG: DNA-3-methyladenine glycosylase [Methanobacteriota archaeon]